jgi:hypothetical protein
MIETVPLKHEPAHVERRTSDVGLPTSDLGLPTSDLAASRRYTD